VKVFDAVVYNGHYGEIFACDTVGVD